MFRICTWVAIFLLLAFIAFCDGISYFHKLYNSVLHPKAWKKVDIVDEKSTFEEMTAIADSFPWTVIERVLWAIAGFLICLYSGWSMDCQVNVLVQKCIMDFSQDLEKKFDSLEKKYILMRSKFEDRINNIASELENIRPTDLYIDSKAIHRSSQTIQVEKYQSGDEPRNEESQVNECCIGDSIEDVNIQDPRGELFIELPPNAIHNELSHTPNHPTENTLPSIKEEQTCYSESITDTRDTVVWRNEIYPVENNLEPISCKVERKGNSDYDANNSKPLRTCDVIEVVDVLDDTPLALGSGECEEMSCAVNQHRRIPQYRALRKGFEVRPAEEHVKVLLPGIYLPDVTPYRATTPRKYNSVSPDSLEPTTANNGSRRKKQRSSNVK